jgi:hypothetical protein
MKRFLIFVTTFSLLFGISVFQASALDVDKYIKDLKQSDPKVRANAAHELGCG